VIKEVDMSSMNAKQKEESLKEVRVLIEHETRKNGSTRMHVCMCAFVH
jgi:hypothetical protein